MYIRQESRSQIQCFVAHIFKANGQHEHGVMLAFVDHKYKRKVASFCSRLPRVVDAPWRTFSAIIVELVSVNSS